MSAKRLSGIWFNQLGSELNIVADDNGGITGRYMSAVGNAQDYYVLVGRFDAAPPVGRGTSVGWTVAYRNTFRNANSTTTWSGQYFDVGGERIITHWLLTSSTVPGSVWNSTNIGNDTFTRTRPSAAEIERARALTIGSPTPEEILATLS